MLSKPNEVVTFVDCALSVHDVCKVKQDEDARSVRDSETILRDW